MGGRDFDRYWGWGFAPELNPVENIWAFRRGNILRHRVYQDYEAVLQACADAWNQLMKLPKTISGFLPAKVPNATSAFD